MEIFDKRFVYSMWDDELKGKKCFVADEIGDLLENVDENKIRTFLKMAKSCAGEYPFAEDEESDEVMCWRFAYYDPNYEVKKAFNEGKEIQFKDDVIGEWCPTYNPRWDLNIEYRVKPEEDERWIVYLRRSESGEGIYLTSCREEDWKEAKETYNAKTKLFVGFYDEAIKWYESRQKFVKVIEAWEDGKIIQYLDESTKTWMDIPKDYTIVWFTDREYRVKPDCPCEDGVDSKACAGCSLDVARIVNEAWHNAIWEEKESFSPSLIERVKKLKNQEKTLQKKERPFKDCDELVEFWSKNYQTGFRPAFTKPLIWVRLKCDGRERLIVAFGTDFVEIGNKAKAVPLQKLFDDYEFLDGSPCGREC